MKLHRFVIVAIFGLLLTITQTANASGLFGSSEANFTQNALYVKKVLKRTQYRKYGYYITGLRLRVSHEIVPSRLYHYSISFLN